MELGDEDYVGEMCSCTSWVAPDAFFSALLVHKIAKGGWGQIYLAVVQSGPATGSDVAVKVVTTGTTFTLSKVDELLYRIFNVEASCLVGMSACPQAAQLLATAEVNKYGFTRYCLVLEWMACGDAQMLLERLGHGLSPDGAGVVMLSVLRAIAHGHAIGYMHRDIKASNILLGGRGQVQLADWGICGVVPGFEDGATADDSATCTAAGGDSAAADLGVGPATGGDSETAFISAAGHGTTDDSAACTATGGASAIADLGAGPASGGDSATAYLRAGPASGGDSATDDFKAGPGEQHGEQHGGHHGARCTSSECSATGRLAGLVSLAGRGEGGGTGVDDSGDARGVSPAPRSPTGRLAGPASPVGRGEGGGTGAGDSNGSSGARGVSPAPRSPTGRPAGLASPAGRGQGGGTGVGVGFSPAPPPGAPDCSGSPRPRRGAGGGGVGGGARAGADALSAAADSPRPGGAGVLPAPFQTGGYGSDSGGGGSGSGSGGGGGGTSASCHNSCDSVACTTSNSDSEHGRAAHQVPTDPGGAGMTHGAGEGEQQQQQQEQQQQQQEQQQRQGEEQPQQQQEQQQRQGDEEQLQQQQQQQEQQHRQEQQQQEQEQNELQEQQETEQEHHHDQQQQQQHGARGDNPGGGQAPLGRGALVGARGAPLGTPFWAAPELDVGDPHDERVDLFSFGVTFVELVTGRQPYYDTSPEGLAWLCSPEVGFLPNDLPEEVLEWLVPCLQAHPDDRPSAEQLLGCDFFVRVAEAEAEAEAANAVHALITDGAEKAGWKLEEEADEMEEADEVEEAGRKLAEEQLPACDAGGEASTQEQHTRLRVPIHEAALADACTFAANPPWLAFTHGCMLGHGVVYQGDGDASDDSWDASLPLVPLAGGDGDIGAAAVAAAAEGAAGADGDGGGGDYPHFDPEVVEEMRLLRLLPRA